MAETFILHVDPERDVIQGGIENTLLHLLHRVHIDVTSTNLDLVANILKQYFGQFSVYCDSTAIEDIQDVIKLINHGALRVFITPEQYRVIREQALLEDYGRLVLVTLSDNGTRAMYDYSQLGGVEIHAREQKLKAQGAFSIYMRFHLDNWDSYTTVIRDGVTPIVNASDVITASSKGQQGLQASDLVIKAAQSDRPDGLFPTVVTDEQGISLGLVYSSEESIKASLETGTGVYYSRSRKGLWHKGATSGDTQELIKIGLDCDADALRFVVRQKGDGFCHLKTATCFGPYDGLSKLEKTLKARRKSAPQGSYTARLFNDPKLLEAKLLEEANELAEAKSQDDVAAEAADLLYFALTKCVASGVSLKDVERSLDRKSLKTSRRKGDAKPQWVEKIDAKSGLTNGTPSQQSLKEAASIPKNVNDHTGTINGNIRMKRLRTSETNSTTLHKALQRPSQRSTDSIMNIVKPIVNEIRTEGDAAVLKYTHKFEGATSLTSPVLLSPFPKELMQLSPETISAIDTSFNNIHKFHAAQADKAPLLVETMPGVTCSRFSRSIEKVGLYVPGGTAVLPSTALMLGVPAMVAGCRTIVMASPPQKDGTLTPEVVYVAHKVGASAIVLAGGAQAVAAMAYGTESIPKVDKILGPGNQFVTAAKMLVSNDTTASVSIDMPAGPSEVMVIADNTANPAFVASDLLSQAEHGVDSQVVLITIDLSDTHIEAIEIQLNAQANALPRVDIIRGAISHSITLQTSTLEEAMDLSNLYAPEHLILQLSDSLLDKAVSLVQNAGSVFIGAWTPESVGDYSAGVNHSLPTYGYARQYSGVNLGSFTKHITSSRLTKEGLRNVGGAVMRLAEVEELEAHKRAVGIRLAAMDEKA